ncbi:hypothetical protein KCU92_g356, partial [Aureobasidium melanogenum]
LGSGASSSSSASSGGRSGTRCSWAREDVCAEEEAPAAMRGRGLAFALRTTREGARLGGLSRSCRRLPASWVAGNQRGDSGGATFTPEAVRLKPASRFMRSATTSKRFSVPAMAAYCARVHTSFMYLMQAASSASDQALALREEMVGAGAPESLAGRSYSSSSPSNSLSSSSCCHPGVSAWGTPSEEGCFPSPCTEPAETDQLPTGLFHAERADLLLQIAVLRLFAPAKPPLWKSPCLLQGRC